MIFDVLGIRGAGPIANAFRFSIAPAAIQQMGRDEAPNDSLLVAAAAAPLLGGALLWAGLKQFLWSLDRLNLRMADERA